MECKEINSIFRQFRCDNWNITRMECKGAKEIHRNDGVIIGIYPEWNVKFTFTPSDMICLELEYIQNGM